MKTRSRFLTKRNVALAVLSVSSITLIALFANRQMFYSARASQPSSVTAQAPRIIVMPQPGSPLRISTVMLDSIKPSMPEVNFSLENVGSKPIRAYAITHEGATDRAKGRGTTLSSVASVNSIMQVGHVTKGHVGGTDYSYSVNSLTIWVDFVEFDDGTTWGDDTSKSLEQLLGQRAGALVTANHLRSLLETNGVNAVKNALSAVDLVIVPPADRSSQWLRGFEMGKSFARGRLQQAEKRGGLSELANVLRHPIDASERR